MQEGRNRRVGDDDSDGLADLLSEEPQGIDLYYLLSQVCEKETVHLTIPETLLRGGVFLYTDATGVVRCVKGQSYRIRRAGFMFESTSTARYKDSRNFNPQGLKFPKFLIFAENQVKLTLYRRSNLQQYLASGEFEGIQRYVLPKGMQVHTRLIQWSRVKPTREFVLNNRLPLKGKQNTLGVDFACITSVRNQKSCHIVREAKPSEEALEVLDTLRLLLETYTLQPSQRFQDLLISCLPAHDGTLYLLSVLKASTIEEDYPIERKPMPLTISELTTRIQDLDIKSPGQRLPAISHIDLSDDINKFSPVFSPSPDNPEPTLSPRYTSTHLETVVEKFDRLHAQSKAVREAVQVQQAMRFQKYSPDFLVRVVNRVYQYVLENEHLARHFEDKSRAEVHISAAVREVFEAGISRVRLRRIHKHMSISNVDYDAYIQYYQEALSLEQAESEDIEATRKFLENFRDDIVARRKGS